MAARKPIPLSGTFVLTQCPPSEGFLCGPPEELLAEDKQILFKMAEVGKERFKSQDVRRWRLNSLFLISEPVLVSWDSARHWNKGMLNRVSMVANRSEPTWNCCVYNKTAYLFVNHTRLFFTGVCNNFDGLGKYAKKSVHRHLEPRATQSIR